MQRKPTIVVYGDVFTDIFIKTAKCRKNPETDCPLLDEYCRKVFPGGAANLALNIAKLRPRFDVVLISPRKIDKEAIDILRDANIKTKILCSDAPLDSIQKTRIMVSSPKGLQNVCRVDSEKIPSRPVFRGVGELHVALNSLNNNVSRIAAIVVSDYSKGSITVGAQERCAFSYSPIFTKLCEAADNSLAPIILDAKSPWWEHDFSVTAVLPNRSEWELAKSSPKDLSSQYPHRFFIETLSEDGINIWNDGKMHHFDAYSVKSPDVAGAGDSVTAAFTVKYVDWQTSKMNKNSFIKDVGQYMVAVGAISVSNEFTYAPSYLDVDNFMEKNNGEKKTIS